MTTTPSAVVFKNELQPAWGLGLVIEDKPDNWVLLFEHAGRKKFIKAKTKSLVAVTLEKDALAVLHTKVHGRAARGPAKAKAKSKPSAATFLSFDEQVKFFEGMFDGGFLGEAFTAKERGVAGGKADEGLKAEAIRHAQAAFSKKQFGTASPDALFEDARALLKQTTIVFPMEGTIPFNVLPEGERPAVVAALKELLHGAGDYSLRVEKFAGALSLKDKKGVAKKVTWPLATLFGAMFAPDENACVKPTVFASQATTLGLQVARTQPVVAAGYQQFLGVAKETQKRLVTAGHKPRDLMDVYSFIWLTHDGKAAQAPAPAVVASA